MKWFLTIYMPLHSNTHPLGELFWDLLKTSSRSPERIYRITLRLTTQLPGWYKFWLLLIISDNQLLKFVRIHMFVHPKQFQVIAAAGAVKHEEVVEQVKKLFTKLSSDPTTTSQLVANEPASFTGSEVRTQPI